MRLSTAYHAVTTSVWYNEDDQVWEWSVNVGTSFERAGQQGTRSAALAEVSNTVGAALD